jgi:hypothetical protein
MSSGISDLCLTLACDGTVFVSHPVMLPGQAL